MSEIHVSCQYTLDLQLEEHQLRRHISMLARAGFEGIYLYPSGGYFSDAWFQAVDTIIEECCQHNMKIFLPVTVETAGFSESYSFQYLTTESFLAQARQCFQAELADSSPVIGCYAVYDSGKIENISSKCGWITPSEPGGAWGRVIDFTPAYGCKVIAVHLTPKRQSCAIDVIDGICNEYYKRYSQYFGNIISAVYTVPPAFGKEYPWMTDFEQRYQEMWQSSIISVLPLLFTDTEDDSSLIRERYHLTLKDLYCRYYLVKLQTWCQNHNIQCAGIVSDECIDFIRCFRHLDTPWITCSAGDIIENQNCAVLLKAVSSASKLFDKRQTGSTIHAPHTALRDLRFIADYQLALGITSFNISGLDFEHAQWEIMPFFINYLKNMCRKLANAPGNCRIAVFYPFSSFCCDNESAEKQNNILAQLVGSLFRNGSDFDFIDEVSLVELTAEVLSEKYDTIIVPEITFINCGAAEVLENYTGRLLCCGKKSPQITSGGKWSYYLANSFSEFSMLRREEITGDGANNIILRRCDDGKVFIFNHSEKFFTGTCNGVDIALAPRCGELLENIRNIPLKIKTTRVLADNWRIEVQKNHIVLPTVQVFFSDGSSIRQDINVPVDKKAVECAFNFVCSGKINTVFLLLEKTFFPGICRINGCELREPYSDAEYQGKYIVYDIARFLLSGDVPQLNSLKFSFSCDVNFLLPIPHFCGKFTASWQYASQNIIHLRESELSFNAPLGDIHSLGIGVLTDKICYSKTFTWRGGYLMLNLSRVEDACTIKIDGTATGTVYCEPYIIDAGFLEPGEHLLEITVYNMSADCRMLFGQPAGLFGPVTLKEYEG